VNANLQTPTALPLLHHYASSPFAEKVRAILGFKGLRWGAVTQPQIMPKPDLQALTGGYRRIPVLQLGADVYCDTSLIAEVLDGLAPDPSLFPEASAAQARILAQWADHTLFWTAMNFNFQPAGASALFKDAPPDALKAFALDRKTMQSPAPRWALGDSTAAYREYLARISGLLAGRAFVCGDAPCIADFAIYHPLWFTRNLAPIAGILDTAPGVSEWLERIAGFSKTARANSEKVSAAQAHEIAFTHAPAPLGQGTGASFVDLHGVPEGSPVSIAAESFGLEPTTGILVAATANRLTIARQLSPQALPSASAVHVHFPRIGFVLKASEPTA
jgi:glutathione S-transferase